MHSRKVTGIFSQNCATVSLKISNVIIIKSLLNLKGWFLSLELCCAPSTVHSLPRKMDPWRHTCPGPPTYWFRDRKAQEWDESWANGPGPPLWEQDWLSSRQGCLIYSAIFPQSSASPVKSSGAKLSLSVLDLLQWPKSWDLCVKL